MNKRCVWLAPTLSVLLLASCASTRYARRDLVTDPFPEAQTEVREAFNVIINDAETANVSGVRTSHLESDKFTKFGGQVFDRQDVEQCNESETAGITSIQDLKYEVKDQKIDVFGDVAIMTFYSHISFKKDGESFQPIARQTIVFLKTADGWKIIHEHVTPKAGFGQ